MFFATQQTNKNQSNPPTNKKKAWMSPTEICKLTTQLLNLETLHKKSKLIKYQKQTQQQQQQLKPV
jgi:hypothetical protein